MFINSQESKLIYDCMVETFVKYRNDIEKLEHDIPKNKENILRSEGELFEFYQDTIISQEHQLQYKIEKSKEIEKFMKILYKEACL